MHPAKTFFALLSVALLLAASDARAAFTYSVAPATTTTMFGVGGTSSTYTVTSAFVAPTTSSVLSGSQGINLVQTTQTSSHVGVSPFNPPTNSDAATIPVSLVVTINNTTDGSGTITVAGNINVTRSDTQGAFSTFSLTSILPSSLTLGNFVYTLSSPTYIAPTISAGGNAGGGLSIFITEASAVPEPTAVVMLGTGLVGAIGLGLRRRVKKS